MYSKSQNVNWPTFFLFKNLNSAFDGNLVSKQFVSFIFLAEQYGHLEYSILLPTLVKKELPHLEQIHHTLLFDPTEKLSGNNQLEPEEEIFF